MTNQPHIVLLMADHLRLDCLSTYGNLPVRTPHLDELADQSVVFEHAYCTTPLCGPTRTSMYTGKYPHQHGAIVNTPPEYGRAGPSHETLYEILDRGGYAITHIGVHHCRTNPSVEERVPAAHFETEEDWRRTCPQESDRTHTLPYVPFNAGKVGDVVNIDEFAPPRRILNPYSVDKFQDVWWSNRMVEEIREMDFSRPRYVEALFWAPHPPLDVPEPYYSMYPPESIELPETVGRWYPDQPATLLSQTCGQMGTSGTRDEYRAVWSAYYGLVTLVDECIGKVITALKARGVWDDCVVVFTQDHGEMLGEHYLYGKNCHYEPACHIPLLIKTPSGKGGQRTDFASAVDYCATVCDYAELTPPTGNVGISLKTSIENEEVISRDCAFMEYNGDLGLATPTRAVVSAMNGEIWKYIYTQGDVEELYNLSKDPQETCSLSESPDHLELRDKRLPLKCVSKDIRLQPESTGHAVVKTILRERLREWMGDTDDMIQLS